MNTLDQLQAGERATIVDVAGEDGIAVRLLEMGLTEGEEIEVVGFAPLGDPIEFQVRGYRVSLRANEARRLHVKPARPMSLRGGSPRRPSCPSVLFVEAFLPPERSTPSRRAPARGAINKFMTM